MDMNGSASAFFSSETAALERELDTNHEAAVVFEEIWDRTHRKVCSGWIRQHGFKRVCLQFPDNYLIHSTAISDSLKESLGPHMGTKIYILADTSYGSCCVDEIAAAHVDGDSIIHFGNACRSKVSGLPVLYMFPHYPMNKASLREHLTKIQDAFVDKEVCVYLDIAFHYLLEHDSNEPDEESFNRMLKDNITCRKLHVETFPSAEDSKSLYEPDDERVCLFIGADNVNFFNLSLTTRAARWFLYDPAKNSLDEQSPLKANYIKRRYYYIEKCKDAQTLGLIVATLTSSGYLQVVDRVQQMAKSHGIKTQIISVGRINPAKLANFLEIDCFVLIGCPFNNMYTSRDFYKPIVSVFEAEMALNPAWHMKYPESYVTDFKELLPQGKRFLTFDPAEIRTDDISLVSGKLRNGAATNGAVEVADTSALSAQQQEVVARGKMEMMTSDVGLTFEDRTWKGLDQALGHTEPAKLKKGLSGIPIKYTHD